MQVQRLTPAHVEEYRAIMLEAYAQEPEAFTATVAERQDLPLAWWAERVADDPDASQLVVGAFVDGRLVGVAGLRPERRPRTRHKAVLFGLFVRPAERGRGVARALVEAVLELARQAPATRIVQLTVVASNRPAIRLYESCGFRSYGTEPFALDMGDRLVSLVHLWCAVGSLTADG